MLKNKGCKIYLVKVMVKHIHIFNSIYIYERFIVSNGPSQRRKLQKINMPEAPKIFERIGGISTTESPDTTKSNI